MNTETFSSPTRCMYPGVVRLWPDDVPDVTVAAELQRRVPRRNADPWTAGQVATWRRGVAGAPDYCRPALAEVLGVTFYELAGAYTVTT